MMNRYFIFLFLILFINQGYSQSEKWSLDMLKSFVSYDGRHFLHSWSGKNEKIRGVLVQKTKSDDFEKVALAMFVKDFNSGNGNRDSNMMELLEVISFPKIEFYSNDISLENNQISFSGSLNFHGIRRDLNINSKIETTNKRLVLSGEFNLSLVDHKVKLPTFMLRSIDKEVLIKYQLIFNKSDN